MKLRDYSDADLWLTELLECDPATMQELGGVTSKDRIPAIHKRRLDSVLSKSVWHFVIVPAELDTAVGTIGIWESEWEGSKINEMGWMILPAFQGRGIATHAGKLIFERARNERKWKEVCAFPSINNAASNAICRKLGFTLIKQVEVSYNGPPHPGNLWKIKLWE
jgi:RimJ/RimL family protein N-acetyltransferase